MSFACLKESSHELATNARKNKEINENCLEFPKKQGKPKKNTLEKPHFRLFFEDSAKIAGFLAIAWTFLLFYERFPVFLEIPGFCWEIPQKALKKRAISLKILRKSLKVRFFLEIYVGKTRKRACSAGNMREKKPKSAK